MAKYRIFIVGAHALENNAITRYAEDAIDLDDNINPLVGIFDWLDTKCETHIDGLHDVTIKIEVARPLAIENPNLCP